MDTFNILKNNFPRLEKDVALKDYTTFRIGGPAKYFLRTSDRKELKSIVEAAKKENIPFLVIGGGSNILFSDKGFNGLVVVYKVENLSREQSLIERSEFGDEVIIKANASVPLSYLVSQLSDLSGLEWAAGIPGTLGGAINGNAGAFNESIADAVISVDVLDFSSSDMEVKMNKRECLFGYRNSIFKNNQDLLIVSAELRFFKADKEDVKKRIVENLEKRRGKQPKGFSAGSVFKNYFDRLDESIVEKYPEMKKINEKQIVPAGLMIEMCGLKGKQIGEAKISDEHANFIINLGNATSEDVLSLINLIKKSVKEKFLVDLKEEIKIF